LEAPALHTLRLIARQPWRHCVTSLRSAHWLASSLKLATLCPLSGCWPSCQVRCNRSDVFMRALCPNGGCSWSPATAVCVNSLHFTASGSDLYWTAQLRVQRSCSVEQYATSLARKHVTGYI